jgi:peptide/nickel transport system substrate-binding protein
MQARGSFQPTVRRRISRRAAVSGLAAGSATLAAIAAGCGPTPSTQGPASSTARQPKRGGVLDRYGGGSGSYDTQGVPFDPHRNQFNVGLNYHLIYQTLLTYDLDTYEVQPELAARWEQPSQTEYVFTLQPGVKWQNRPPANGRELTVEDVVFSLNRARTNEPTFVNRSLLDALDRMEAINKTTLKIVTKEPSAIFLSNLSSDPLAMMAPEVVEKASKFATPEEVVGTGAFMLKSVQEGVLAEYVRNPDYWKPGRPYLDGVRMRHFLDEGVAFAAFRAGEIDIVRMPGEEAKKYNEQQGPNYRPYRYKDHGGLMAQPNTKVKPMDDVRVTRALRLLVDYEEYIKGWADLWFGGGRNASIFPPAIDVWDLSHEEYYKYLPWKQPKDEAAREAIALLSAAGFTPANPLKFELSGGEGSFSKAASELLDSQWRKFSRGAVQADIKVYNQVQQNTIRANRSFTFFFGGGLSAGTPEPDAFLTSIYRTGGSRNFAGTSDAKLDAMIDKQRTIFDLKERRAAVREIILYSIDNGVNIIPAGRFFYNAVKPHVRDYQAEFYVTGRQYEWVWLDV